MNKDLTKLAIVVLIVCGTARAKAPAAERQATDEPARKVLVIGIDGCRYDALTEADTPNLDRLIAAGAVDPDCQILGDRYRQNDTVSGPGWSTILTGVWADKHSVDDNSFDTPNYEQYPHFFQRLKEVQPQAETASFVNWEPIHDYIVSGADVDEVFSAEGTHNYAEVDEELTEAAVAYLRSGDPTAVFVYLGEVDVTGHGFGFHPTVPEYVQAIERVDGFVGQILEALESRPSFAREEWLILVTSDHGGQGTGHSGGHNVPEILNSFLIVSGAAAARGEIEQTTYLVDVVPTALTYLGVEPQEIWGLDGHRVGLKEE